MCTHAQVHTLACIHTGAQMQTHAQSYRCTNAHACMYPHRCTNAHTCRHTCAHANIPLQLSVSLRDRVSLSQYLLCILKNLLASCLPVEHVPHTGTSQPCPACRGCSAAIWSQRLISVGRSPTWPQLHLEAGLADKLVLEGGEEGEQRGAQREDSKFILCSAKFQLSSSWQGCEG
jgi:hypothetical protein